MTKIFRNILAAATLLTGFGPAAAQQMEAVAAIVNDEVISTFDVRQRMRLYLLSAGVRPDDELLRRVQAQALSSLINERLQLQEADRFEVEVSQEEIDSALGNLARQNNMSPDTIRSDLQSQGISPATLEQQLRSEISWQILVSGRYRPRVRVSNDQIEQRLQRLAASASRPRYHLAEIFLERPVGAGEAEMNAIVSAVTEQLRGGAPFPVVARQYSSAPSAANGGDMGWMLSGELRPEIENIISSLQPGDLSQPLPTEDGVYLLALLERNAGADPERLRLMQLLVPVPSGSDESLYAAAEQNLNRRRGRIRGCDDVEAAAQNIEGSRAADLGTVAPSDLSPAFRNAVSQLQEGQTTTPLRTGPGVVMITLCERTLAAGDVLPSRDAIEDSLLEEQLSLLARRWLRDLRRDATIETRVR